MPYLVMQIVSNSSEIESAVEENLADIVIQLPQLDIELHVVMVTVLARQYLITHMETTHLRMAQLRASASRIAHQNVAKSRARWRSETSR